MKTTIIRRRVADFLKAYPPFETISDEDLLELAGSGRVRFHESGEYVYRQGDAKGQFVWVVQQGKVELVDQRVAGEPLRDVLGEGDLLGIERFAGEASHLYSARTSSDVILYGLSAQSFEGLLPKYPSIQRFLSARISFAEAPGSRRSSWLDAEFPPVEFLQARNPRPRDGAPVAQGSLTVRTAVALMLESRSEELTLESGAVLTAEDMALFCGENPAAVVSGMWHAGGIAELAPLYRQAQRITLSALAQPADVDDCLRISGEARVALAEACIRLAGETLNAPHCWILYGAAARDDIQGMDLPTLGIIHDGPVEDGAAVVEKTTRLMQECGLRSTDFIWPEGSAPCLQLGDWVRLCTETIQNPLGHNLFARRGFFDLRLIAGDPSILLRLHQAVSAELDGSALMIALLANDTLANLPPLTFFRGLVLDLDGGQRDSLDLDKSVLGPVAAAARVFAIAKRRLATVRTMERLRQAAADFPEGAQILEQAADAFRLALYHRWLAGSARIRPLQLARFDQLLLKSAFPAVQRLLEFTATTFLPEA